MRRRNALTGITAGATSLAMIFTGGSQAAVADADDSDLDRVAVVDALRSVPDELLALPEQTGAGARGGAVDLPDSPGDSAAIHSPHGEIAIGLPFSTGSRVDLGAGLVGFDNENGTWSVPIAHSDGSMQLTTVIEDHAAPTEYRHDLQLPEGATARDIDGFITLWSANGQFLGGVAPAWAVDSSGVAVPTSFRLEGTTLVQLVAHDDSHTYPVVADPWLGANLFGNRSVTSASGDLRYNFSRTAWGVAVHTGVAGGGGLVPVAAGIAILQTAGWDELKTGWPAITNKETLRQQYDCHVVGGFFEQGWNLERFRVNKSNWQATAATHRCNW